MTTDEKAPDILKLDINAWGESWGIIHAMPHEFKTGSAGFYGTGKIVNPENPRARYQVCVNITLIGSKMYINETDKSGNMPVLLFRHIRGMHAFLGGLYGKH